MGAQLNVVAGLTKEGKLFLTQYIGDGGKQPTQRFLEVAVSHFRRMFGIDDIEAIVADMHPRYSTLRMARSWEEELDVPLVRVQHHHAHASSLLLEHEVEEAVVMTIDGLGYGPDGVLWGGEVLDATAAGYRRVGHIEELPMLGGEAAVFDPRRILWAAYHLLGRKEVPPSIANEEETRIWELVVEGATKTSGLGRFLDAVAVHLGVAGSMTYDGEPAMRLEPLLVKGRSRPEWGFETHRTREGVVEVLPVLDTLFDIEVRSHQDMCDAAFGAVRSVVIGLTDTALDLAQEQGLPVGVSGGVAYSIPIMEMISSRVEGEGIELLIHDRIPPGDGGISAGQAYVAGARLDAGEG
jgi:hydrogenase maturation protein HypF